MTLTASDLLDQIDEGAEHLLLEDVTWEFYEALLGQTQTRHLRITYDEGRLELISPLPRHERVKQVVGGMLTILAVERGIAMRQLGSTTFRKRKKRKGLEPDQCYYVQSEWKIRTKDHLDLKVDPPPDLALEVDVTNWSIKRLPIYAALGVPEIWRHDGKQLFGLKLSRDGEYEPAEMSLAFPFLRVAELNRFLEMWPTTEETALLRAFRDWVRAGLT
jgi:Uma2 family endonuclease